MSNPDELRAAAQQALVALVHHTEQTRPIQRTADAIAALRAALARPAASGEPVVYVNGAALKSAAVSRERGGPYDLHTWSESRTMHHDTPLTAATAQPASARPEAVEALAHRIAWRYKKSSDLAHSDTYTFNRSTLLQFAQALQAAPARAPLTEAQIKTMKEAAADQGLTGIAPSLHLARAVEAWHGIPAAPTAQQEPAP